MKYKPYKFGKEKIKAEEIRITGEQMAKAIKVAEIMINNSAPWALHRKQRGDTMKYCVIFYGPLYPHDTADYQIDWYETAEEAKQSAKYVTEHEPGYSAEVMEKLTEFSKRGKEVTQ